MDWTEGPGGGRSWGVGLGGEDGMAGLERGVLGGWDR